MIPIEARLIEFKELGYAVFEGVYPAPQLRRWRESYPDLVRRATPPGSSSPNPWIGNLVELDVPAFLPLVANPEVLDFAEAVMGPFVQLDGTAMMAFPSMQPAEAAGRVNVWHRDRYSEMPVSTAYAHPVACNAITYLQDLTDEYGPLRVVPGSHRMSIRFEETDRNLPRADEALLRPKAGDVVLTHAQLAHAGTPNVSGKPRYFLSAAYNRSWMMHCDNFDGPGIAALVAAARVCNDRRMLRLFGVHPLVRDRSNPYFLVGSEEDNWRRWIGEDRAALLDEKPGAAALPAPPGTQGAGRIRYVR